MKRLDQIIKEHVDRTILEQATANWKQYTKLKPTTSNANKYTKNPISFNDTYFQPWPIHVSKPTPWQNQNMERFLKNRLKAIAVRPASDIPDAELESKKVRPIYIWKFADEIFLFGPTGLAQTQNSSGDYYWAYDSEPFRTSDFVNPGDVAASFLPFSSAQAPSVKVNVWSYPGTGHIVLRTKQVPYKNPYVANRYTLSLPEAAHSFIYINSQGGYNVVYADTLRKRALAKGKEDIKQTVRNAMDIFGMIPVWGDILDLTQAVWYLNDWKKSGDRWDLVMAALSMLSVVPVMFNIKKSMVATLIRDAKRVKAEGLGDLMKKTISADMTTPETKQRYCMAMIWLADHFSDIQRPIKATAEKAGFEGIVDALTELQREASIAKTLSQDYLDNLAKRGAKLIDDIPAGKVKGKWYRAIEPGTDEIRGVSWWRADKRIGNFAYNYTKSGDVRTFADNLIKYIPAGKLSSLLSKGSSRIAELLTPLQFGRARQKALISNLRAQFKKSIVTDPEKFLLMAYHSYKRPGPKLNDVLSIAIFRNSAARAIDPADLIKFKNAVSELIIPQFDAAGKAIDPIVRFTRNLSLDQINDALDKGATYTIRDKNVLQELHTFLKQKLDAKTYSRIVQAVDEMINADNPVWREVILDPVATMKAYFPESFLGKEWWKMLWGNIGSIRKLANDAAELIHEALEDTDVVEKDENESSTIYYLIRQLINDKPANSQDGTIKQLYNTAKQENINNANNLKSFLEIDDRTKKVTSPFAGLHPDSTAYAKPVKTINMPTKKVNNKTNNFVRKRNEY